MSGIRPKQFARIGEFCLEEAVLDVLLEAKHGSECLGPAEISKRMVSSMSYCYLKCSMK